MKAHAALALTLACNLVGCDKSANKQADAAPAPQDDAESTPESQRDEPAAPTDASDSEVSEPEDAAQQVATRAKAAANARDAFADVKLGEKTEMAPGVFMTMYKANEENPVDGGWHRGTSTNGKFSVELPLPFNDFRITAQAKDGGDLQTDTVGAKTPGLLAYSATCISSSTEFPEDQCDKTLGKIGRATAIDGDRDGMKGMEAKMDTAHGQCWAAADAKRTCFLIVESQGEDALPGAEDRARFFESFTPGG